MECTRFDLSNMRLPGVGDVGVACLSLGEDFAPIEACCLVRDMNPGAIAFPNELVEIAKVDEYLKQLLILFDRTRVYICSFASAVLACG